MLRSALRLTSKLSRSVVSAPVRFNSTSRALNAMKSTISEEIASFENLIAGADPLASIGTGNTVASLEGDEITVKFDSQSHHIAATFTKEFDYQEGEPAENETEAEEVAFHPMRATITPLGKDANSVRLSLVGEMHLDGHYVVSEVTPVNPKGEVQRTLSLSDLDEQTTQSIFEALEACGLTTDVIEAMAKHARRVRIEEHISALNAINAFVDSSV